MDRGIEYWKAQLAGAPEQLALPTDRPRPPVLLYTAKAFHDVLPIDLTERLIREAAGVSTIEYQGKKIEIGKPFARLPIPEAVAWAERADAWAQRSDAEQGGQIVQSRWSEVAAPGRTAFPEDGVGWRTETAEWRATEQTARWRQTTEWRSASGTHGWRSTTEAWQTGAGAEQFQPPADPQTRQQLALSGTAWPTPQGPAVEGNTYREASAYALQYLDGDVWKDASAPRAGAPNYNVTTFPAAIRFFHINAVAGDPDVPRLNGDRDGLRDWVVRQFPERIDAMRSAWRREASTDASSNATFEPMTHK